MILLQLMIELSSKFFKSFEPAVVQEGNGVLNL
jgi:hypothetical protein